jgi:simple sugar transport system permease protein
VSARSRERTLPVASSLLAVLLAFLAGGLFLELRGKDALEAYRILFERSIFDNDGLTESFKKMAPLLIVSAGLLVALKAGIWNIGVDGQFITGALVAAVVGASLQGDLPNGLMWLAAGFAGLLTGLAWAVIPAALKVRFGLNEIITTLMMNYVAFNVTIWLVKGPARDPGLVAPETRKIELANRLPDIPGTEVHIGLLVGLVCVAAAFVLFRSTVPGYMLTVMGRNRRAAVHAGMPVAMLTVWGLLISGAFAGLAGANDVLGVQGVFKANWHPGYGFTAFALVYLARLNSLAIVPFAFFFSFLTIGGDSMARRADVPSYFVEMLEGLMLIFFAFVVYLERRFGALGRRAVADDLERAATLVEPTPAGTGEAR